MLQESIIVKKQREKVLSECRSLLFKINSKIPKESQKSAPLSVSSVQTFEDNSQPANTCACCHRSNIPDEKMTRSESGHRLCINCFCNRHKNGFGLRNSAR